MYVVCRRGWDSQTAVELLQSKGLNSIYMLRYIGAPAQGWIGNPPVVPLVTNIIVLMSGDIYHIEGGLVSWSQNIDSTFPIY